MDRSDGIATKRRPGPEDQVFQIEINEMTNVSIHTYRRELQSDIIDLILGIQKGEFAIDITAEDQPDLKDIPNFYQSGSGNFWVALIGGKVVGTIASRDIGNHSCALRKMFVQLKFRGDHHQIAKKLLDAMLHWSRRHGVRNIYLGTISKYLAAHRFYEKNSFKEIPKESLPDSFPVMAVDNKFYHRQLSGR